MTHDLPSLAPPYLIFLGSADAPLDCKTGRGIADWRPERCLAELSLEGCTQTLGLPQMDPTAAAKEGARTLVIGTVSAGGVLPDEWLSVLVGALEAGLDIASGMHSRLRDVPELVSAADEHQRRLLDVRDPNLWRGDEPWKVGTGTPRAGTRILTVGTDCSVGKMYTALALERGLVEAGVDAEFKATGQTGILIVGSGVPVDAMVSDFISGSVERLSPADTGRVHVVEGQGSLHHPSFAGVSLGLLHGAQPDLLVVCHEPTRSHMRHVPHLDPPSLAETVEVNLLHARRTNPEVAVLGFSVNTSGLEPVTADSFLADVTDELDLPAVDPVRTGVGPLVERYRSLAS